MTTRDCDLAAATADAIRDRIGEARYRLWFADRTRLSWGDDGLTVGVPNLHFQEWLHKTFGESVRLAAAAVAGDAVAVRFVIDPGLFQAIRQEQAAAAEATGPLTAPVPDALPAGPAPDAPPPAPRPRGKAKAPPGPGLFDHVADNAAGPAGARAAAGPQSGARPERPAPRGTRRWHRLGDFVVGPCNRVAHASALSVVEEPGLAANPLVLYGPTGTGKTHLLEGIYVGLRRARPEARVLYTRAEEFTNRFVQAMRLGKLTAFRRSFRECDALLLDDLHFLASKKATVEEFQHTLDVLLAEGRQVVVSCDCHPRLADEWPADLADRLLGGAVWGLAPPDPATRRGILEARAAGSAPLIPPDVIEMLAGRLRGNARELEGALHALRHYSKVTGRPVDVALAGEALADLLRHAVRVVRLEDIDAAVCRALRLGAGALQEPGRTWAVSHPRMLAIYLARKHTAASYSDVGRYFGNRNHSTAVAAEKKVRGWLDGNERLVLGEHEWGVRDLLERIERELWR